MYESADTTRSRSVPTVDASGDGPPDAAGRVQQVAGQVTDQAQQQTAQVAEQVKQQAAKEEASRQQLDQ